ncbi:MAG TPA: hypothetical protein PKI00_02565 [Candidatus Pacearchaeota archaeon]|nr:hypothetical protein [Candidatus Pacearchaeota archaeon]
MQLKNKNAERKTLLYKSGIKAMPPQNVIILDQLRKNLSEQIEAFRKIKGNNMFSSNIYSPKEGEILMEISMTVMLMNQLLEDNKIVNQTMKIEKGK